jgi:hypothetical protein
MSGSTGGRDPSVQLGRRGGGFDTRPGHSLPFRRSPPLFSCQKLTLERELLYQLSGRKSVQEQWV